MNRTMFKSATPAVQVIKSACAQVWTVVSINVKTRRASDVEDISFVSYLDKLISYGYVRIRTLELPFACSNPFSPMNCQR